MKTYIKIFTFILALFALAGVQNINAQKHKTVITYNDGTTKVINCDSILKIDFEYNPYIQNDYTDTIRLMAGAGFFGYPSLYSGHPITIEEDCDWFDVELTRSPSDSTNFDFNYSYYVYTSINDSNEDRTGSFKIKSGDKEITQQVKQYRYTSSFGYYIPAYDGSPIKEIDANIEWNDSIYTIGVFPGFGIKLLSYPKWIKAIECINEGEGNTQPSKVNLFTSVTIRTENNISKEPLTGIILLEDKYGEQLIVNLTKEAVDSKVITDMTYHFGRILGESHHNDFGYPAIMMWSDTRGTDMVSPVTGYNWFNSPLEYTDIKPTGVGTNLIWRTMYGQILEANNFINSIENNADENHLKFHLAQAHLIRAFDYFTLAQFYQQTYVGNEEKPCVPIVTETNSVDAANNSSRRYSVREVYEYILNDLNRAIALLSETTMSRPDKRYASLEVVYGMRARVNLVMNNWAAAAGDAEMALKGGATPYSIAEVSKPGFSEIEDASWMWGCLVAETDRPATSGICNFPSHMGSLNYGYASVGAWRYINKSLYNSIPDTDVRKGWWLDADKYSPYLNAEQAAYAAEAGCPAYTQMKFGCYKDEVYTSTNANDIPLMRVEEMYLILAEAQAMAGDPAAGAATLENFVKRYRDPAYTCIATTSKAVQEAAWQQRRIELWGEGFSYTDLLRLKKGVDRRGGGYEPKVIFNIPAGDDVLIYPIPQSAMDKNPNLIQNPEATAPQPVTE